MDIFNIFDMDPLSLTLSVCSAIALTSAFCTLSLYVGPMKQFLCFANVVANTRKLWNFLEDKEWAHCGSPSPKWLDALTRAEADVGRHAVVTLLPSTIAQVSRSWLTIVELLYLTVKIVRLHGHLQTRYLAYTEELIKDSEVSDKILDSPV